MEKTIYSEGYSMPEITVLEIEVEQGFAPSGFTGEDGNEGWI